MPWEVKYRDTGEVVTPRTYSTGLTQDKVAEMISDAWVKEKKRDIVLQAAPGTGKSLIALYATWLSGFRKAIVIVPTRALQVQYEVDYDYERGRIRVGDLSVGIIWGKRNFRCPIHNVPVDKAPCSTTYKYAKLTDKFRVCPLYAPPLRDKVFNALKDIGFEFEEVGRYENLDGSTIILYSRPHGVCPYYAQFSHYITKDVIVLNDYMWIYELRTGRLVKFEVEIMDEFDTILHRHLPVFYYDVDIFDPLEELLENFEPQTVGEEERAEKLRGKLRELKRAMKEISDKDDFITFASDYLTLSDEILSLVSTGTTTSRGDIEKSPDIEFVVNRVREGLEIVTKYYNAFEFTRLETYRIALVSVWPSEYYKRTLLKTPRLARRLFMSATVPDDELLKYFYGIEPDAKIVVEKKAPGVVYLGGTFEMDVSGKLFKISRTYRETYGDALYNTVMKARSEISPRLGIITAYHYVEKLKQRTKVLIDEDGSLLHKLRKGELDEVWSTRAFRGIDLPNVRAIIITKFPAPDLLNPFWSTLRKRRPVLFKQLYYAFGRFNLYQAICRALRDESCWVVIYSPDLRVKMEVLRFAKEGLIELRPFRELVEKLNIRSYVKVIGKEGELAGKEWWAWRAQVEEHVKLGLVEIVEEREPPIYDPEVEKMFSEEVKRRVEEKIHEKLRTEPNVEVYVMFLKDFKNYRAGNLAKLPLKEAVELEKHGVVIVDYTSLERGDEHGGEEEGEEE